MYSAITNNIKVEVVPKYEDQQSNPLKSHFVFSYNVHIINNGSHTVQLLRRHWIIKSADSIVRDVEGEGVIGKQPIIQPGEHYHYQSWAPISCEIGEMYGTFTMKYVDSDELFEIEVPKFQFITDPLLN